MDAAVLHAYPLEGEVRCMQHTLSPQVMEWYILGAEPAYANNKYYFCSVLNWITKNTLFAELLCPMELESSNEVFKLLWFWCGQVQLKVW